QQSEFSVREGAQIAMSPGDVDTLHVIIATQNGRTVNPLTLQWGSTDQSVARVSLSGVVTAVGPGKATLGVSGLLQNKNVEVSVHQVVDKLSVRPRLSTEVLVPLTGTAKFEAQALTAANVPVPEAPLRWSVADSTIATFDPRIGTLTGRAVGKTQLTARGPGAGLAVTWNVAVIAGTPRFVQQRIGMGVNQRHALRANYADSAGNILAPATNPTWSSDNPQIATVGVYVVGEIVVASSRAGPGKYQLDSAERSNLAQFTKLSADTASASDPAFSPDGSRVAFVSLR